MMRASARALPHGGRGVGWSVGAGAGRGGQGVQDWCRTGDRATEA